MSQVAYLGESPNTTSSVTFTCTCSKVGATIIVLDHMNGGEAAVSGLSLIYRESTTSKQWGMRFNIYKSTSTTLTLRAVEYYPVTGVYEVV